MNNIEVARKARNMTRPELAHIAGVTPGTVYAWERYDKPPELRTAIRVADALEVSLDFLFGRSTA